MILRFALPLCELAAIGLLVAASASATASRAPVEMAVAGMAAVVFALLRSLAISEAAGRRFDAAMAGLRAPPPSNDAGGL